MLNRYMFTKIKANTALGMAVSIRAVGPERFFNEAVDFQVTRISVVV